MMCRGSKGLVLGGALACVGASRSKVDMKSAGAVQAVDTIASMLSLQHEEIRRIAEAVDAQATPGASDPYTNSLKKVVDKIKVELKAKVTEAQDAAQNNIDDALTAVQEAEAGAVVAKGVADKQDKAWFACVSQELNLKTFQETAEEKLAAAKQDEQEAHALEQKSSAFTFDAGDKYQMEMECDNDVEGECMQAKGVLIRSMKKMLQDASAALKAKQNYYNDVVAELGEREQETVAAEQVLETAGENHASHRNRCQASKLRRDRAICEYGDTLQAKGVQEGDFKAVIAAVDGKSEMSESDRVQEWKTLSHTECMLERGIEKGLEEPIDDEDHQACSELPDLEALDRKTAEIGQLSESHANEAGPITFGSGGEGWKVTSNGEAAADYTKEDFKPTLNPNPLQQPFGVCPQANVDSWKAVVADQLEGASKVPSAWATLMKMWGQ